MPEVRGDRHRARDSSGRVRPIVVSAGVPAMRDIHQVEPYPRRSNRCVEQEGTMAIKTCPFCGSNALKVHYIAWSTKHYVRCLSCDAHGPLEDTPDDAIVTWNLASDSECEE